MAPVRPVSVPFPPPSPLPPDLRQSLLSALLSTSAISRIHISLLSACQASGWLDAARARALQLTRNGESLSLDEVMDIMLKEAKIGAERADEIPAGQSVERDVYGSREVNGLVSPTTNKSDGKHDQVEFDNALNDFGKTSRAEKNVNITLPQAVTDDGLKIVRESLEKIVEFAKDEGDRS